MRPCNVTAMATAQTTPLQLIGVTEKSKRAYVANRIAAAQARASSTYCTIGRWRWVRARAR